MDKAQKAFQQIYESLTDPGAKEEFLRWIFESRGQSAYESLANKMQAADKKIAEITEDLRKMLPQDGLVKSEKIYFPTQGENADCDPKHTVNVDAFLYDDWMLEKLFEDGKLARSYCKGCGSHDTGPITYISHSLSKGKLQFLFLSLLPDLQGKTVLDIGSRLGAVLYGAYLYSTAKNIVGVEMNGELCELQQRQVDAHALADRIKVVHGDVRQHADLVKQADVVVIHSVIDFFLPGDEHATFWTFVRDNVARPGVLLVTTPSLDRAMAHLKIGIDLSKWVKPFSVSQGAEIEAQNDPDLADLHVYECI